MHGKNEGAAHFVVRLVRTLSALSSAFVNCDDARKLVQKRFQSYDTRCNLAFCLGYYTRDSLTDLASLGWIRNRFAHRRAAVSFSSLEVQDRCLNLKTIRAIEGWNDTNPRNCFIATVAVTSVALTHRAQLEPQRASWGHLWEVDFLCSPIPNTERLSTAAVVAGGRRVTGKSADGAGVS